MEGLRKQLAKLDERARAKEQDLDDTLSKLEAFYKAYDSVMDDVQEVRMLQVLRPFMAFTEQKFSTAFYVITFVLLVCPIFLILPRLLPTHIEEFEMSMAAIWFSC